VLYKYNCICIIIVELNMTDNGLRSFITAHHASNAGMFKTLLRSCVFLIFIKFDCCELKFCNKKVGSKYLTYK